MLKRNVKGDFMRVAMIGWEFPPNITGGLGTHLRELTATLGKRCELHVFIPGVEDFTERHERFTAHLIKTPRIKNIYENMDIVKNYNKEVVKRVIKIDVEKPINVIHAHDWLTAAAGIELKTFLKKPLVFSVHSLEKQRTLRDLDNYPSQMEKLGVEKSDAVITVSKMMKKILVSDFGANEKKIKVIYNAYEERAFEYVDIIKKYMLRKPLIVFLGRLTEQKGPENLIYAAKKVLDRKKANFVFVGAGHLVEPLKRFARTLGIENQVMFTGFVSEDEKKSFLQEADIIVLPSKHEPFGIVALEALSFRKPTILSKNFGALELVRDAVVVSDTKSDALAAAILDLLGSDEKRKQLSKKAGEVVKSLPTWEDVASMTMEVYDGVVYS